MWLLQRLKKKSGKFTCEFRESGIHFKYNFLYNRIRNLINCLGSHSLI